MRYLLDVNGVIALLNDTISAIARRIRRYAPRDFGVSAVVIHQLYYGAFTSQWVEKNVARRCTSVPGLKVEDWKGSTSQRRRK